MPECPAPADELNLILLGRLHEGYPEFPPDCIAASLRITNSDKTRQDGSRFTTTHQLPVHHWWDTEMSRVPNTTLVGVD